MRSMPAVARSPLSRRALAVEESATLAVSEKAARLRAQGVDVVSFGAGEPDFDTPEHIKRAATDALAKGYTKYTASSGILPLRKAAAEKIRRDQGLDYAPEQVLISCGAKHSIFNALHALLDPEDEALIPSPYWTSYPEMVKTTGARPVILPTTEEQGFKLTPAALEAAVTPRTKLLIHCSPSNPTGAVYTPEETRALAEVIVRRDLWVISDEVYEKMIYGGRRHASMAAAGGGILDRTIVVHSCSKTYAMTGWRLGFAAGPREVIDGAARIQGQATSNPASVSQYAALAALEGDQSCISTMMQEYARRREIVLKRLRTLPGVSVVEPDGAFFAFPRVDAHYGRRHRGKRISSSFDLCTLLLDHALVAFVPGAAFGDDRFIRMSYATSMEKIAQGLDRLERFLRELE